MGYEDDLAVALTLLDIIVNDPLSSKPECKAALAKLDVVRDSYGKKISAMLQRSAFTPPNTAKVAFSSIPSLPPPPKEEQKVPDLPDDPPPAATYPFPLKVPSIIPPTSATSPPTVHPTQRLMLGWNDDAKELLYGGWCFPAVKLCRSDEKKLLEVRERIGKVGFPSLSLHH